ncbi:hypothetical protein, partial [Aeromonas fluvialis]|uniref:hypothetical protein n=1 Tax=Aeromonas fluvialis TaxID=591962 RepID=UPI001AD7ECFA
MIKKNKISVAIASVIFSGFLYAATTEQVIIPFVPGETKVSNGDMVSYNGGCFIAKNNPGVWETPAKGSWFWDEAEECSGEPSPPPSPAPGDVIPFIPGQTLVKNGDIVSYKDECFIAKNNPGKWETPSANSWFWSLTKCPDDVTDPIILPPGSGTPITDPDNPDNRPSDPQVPDIPLVPGKPGDPVILPPGSGTPITDPDN